MWNRFLDQNLQFLKIQKIVYASDKFSMPRPTSRETHGEPIFERTSNENMHFLKFEKLVYASDKVFMLCPKSHETRGEPNFDRKSAIFENSKNSLHF